MSDTSTVALVRAAKSPQEAMLAIAAALDQIEERLAKLTVQQNYGWSEWDSDEAHLAAHHELAARTKVVGDESHTDVVLPPVSDEKKEWRRHFEQQYLKLVEHLGDEQDWTEVYAKGGPAWLYHGNRDLVMSFPEQIRAAMVADIEEQSPEEAHEIARDILKFNGETGPGAVAMGIDLMARPGDRAR